MSIYEPMTSDDFSHYLLKVLQDKPAFELLYIDGIQEILMDHFNNEILQSWLEDHGVMTSFDITVRVTVEHSPVENVFDLVQDVSEEMNYEIDTRFLEDANGFEIGLKDTEIIDASHVHTESPHKRDNKI